MQHGWMGHGANLYEELVRTVLVFRWRGTVRVQRSPAPVGLIDVAPTILALIGLDASDLGARGIDLGPALRDGVAPPGDRPLYFQRRLYLPGSRDDLPVQGDMNAVRVGPWKYLEDAAGAELYDLASDPGETRNLGEHETARTAELAATLAKWRAGQPRPAERRLSPADAARLRALGYVE